MKNKSTTATTPTRPELSFDGFGINRKDEYATRIATFVKVRGDDANHYGPLFAASPDLLAAIRPLVAIVNGAIVMPTKRTGYLNAARAAIAKATAKV